MLTINKTNKICAKIFNGEGEWSMNLNLSETQLEKLIDWDDVETGHSCNYNMIRKNENGSKYKYYGLIESHLTFSITPRAIGNKVIVKCNLCGKSIDLTEINDISKCG